MSAQKWSTILVFVYFLSLFMYTLQIRREFVSKFNAKIIMWFRQDWSHLSRTRTIEKYIRRNWRNFNSTFSAFLCTQRLHWLSAGHCMWMQCFKYSCIPCDLLWCCCCCCFFFVVSAGFQCCQMRKVTSWAALWSKNTFLIHLNIRNDYLISITRFIGGT